jgi:hypothetical protein
MSIQRPTNAGAADLHGISSLVRLALVFASITFFMWFGGVVFNGLDFQKIASEWLTAHPTLKIVPFPQFYAVLLKTETWRYCLTPLLAMFSIFLGTAFFVKDIYAVERLQDTIHFVITAMFALLYPKVKVKAGETDLIKGKENILDKIGGPGFCSIDPGNVVMFHRLRERSNITLGETYFLTPFEKIGHITNLDDHHGARTNIGTVTRDGIKVTIKDIQFRYRVLPALRNGRPIRRTPENPYPFDETALENMMHNLAVEEKGQETWDTAVSRAIVGGITFYINDHNVDYLTAPRGAQQDPRIEIRNNLFYGRPRNTLRDLGAELLWIDLGHFSIDDDTVDETRQDYWAADWLGGAMVTRESGLAKRQAYADLGRARAQADLIVSIAEALQLARTADDPAASMRTILLVKTAELMDAYKAPPPPPPEEKK